MSIMADLKCNSLAKQNLFSDKRNAFESRLKQNVIYRRDYTLRPTHKLDQSVDNNFNKCQTKGNNSKNSSNQRTNSSPVKAKQTFVCSSERNSYSTDAIKPVIQVKPKAVVSPETQTQDKFESKAPDIRRRAARSASLPVISMGLKPSTGSDKSEELSPNSQQVMNNIRRRVSQIIDSQLLSGDEDRTDSSDSHRSMSTIDSQRTGKRKFKSRARSASKTNDSGFCRNCVKHLFLNNTQKQSQELNDKNRYDSDSDDNQRLDCGETEYQSFLRRHRNKQIYDKNSSEDNTEEEEDVRTEISQRIKQIIEENLNKNSYSLIHNLNGFKISD